MRDERYMKLAQNLINYSVDLQPGEKVLISVSDGEIAMGRELIRAAYEAGGLPFLKLKHSKLNRELLKGATKEQLELQAKLDRAEIEEMDATISIVRMDNVHEMAGIPAEQLRLWSQHYGRHVKTTHKKWCALRFPNDSMAQLAKMSTEEFEDYYFQVCTLDYAKMSAALKPLAELMRRTDRVRITGPGTELAFSIKDIPVIESDGRHNVPDGEIFTAPVRDSINGTIRYNAPSHYQGFLYENVSFTFRDGKIVEATANNNKLLERLLDTDEGSRYIGEFALGFNPHILQPMADALFDEKIAGSFHLTPGNAYEVACNGNRSSIHWDLVCIQRPEYGGGEIWFDDVLIRKDGLFVLPELEGLNPDNLR